MEEKSDHLEQKRLDLVRLFQDTDDELLISAVWDQLFCNVELTAEQCEWINSRLEKSEEDFRQGRVHTSDEIALIIANLGE